MDRYAVMGNPIKHSLSPVIHQLFAKQTKQDLSYEAIQVAHEDLSQAIDYFEKNDGKGLNITIPFKQEAYALVDKKSMRAELAQAINTIRFEIDGKRFGDNTDGVGLLRDLSNHDVMLRGKRILIVGAGGAVRGVLGVLLEQYPQEIVMANRTASKAIELADIFHSHGTISARNFSELADETFDLIINGTSASLQNSMLNLPDGLLRPNAICYDMVYAAQPTLFLQWAKQQGASRCLDGLGMLVEQAAEAFFVWRQVRPETISVLDYLRRFLKK